LAKSSSHSGGSGPDVAGDPDNINATAKASRIDPSDIDRALATSVAGIARERRLALKRSGL
jgi:hypothetical protein